VTRLDLLGRKHLACYSVTQRLFLTRSSSAAKSWDQSAVLRVVARAESSRLAEEEERNAFFRRDF